MDGVHTSALIEVLHTTVLMLLLLCSGQQDLSMESQYLVWMCLCRQAKGDH